MPLSLRENIVQSRRLPQDEEILCGRAELLAPADRDLVMAVLIRNESPRLLGRLSGLGSRAIRERVKRLGRRLCSRRFLDAARALAYLPPEDARLARLWFCQAIPQREICRRMGISIHSLRRRLDRLSAQIATLRRVFQNGRAVVHRGGGR